MQVLYPRCCALDVHKETVVACLRLVIDDKVVKKVRTRLQLAERNQPPQFLARPIAKCHLLPELARRGWYPPAHIRRG